LKASAAQILVIARAQLNETPPTRVPHPWRSLPLDPTTIFFRPADDDPLPSHRNAAAIWLALAVACTAAWTVATVALAIWES
jgi:hypothetical protein